MSRTIGNLSDSVSGILTGTNLNNVTGLYKAFERASRRLLQKADIPDAMTQEAVTIYDGVFDYTAPSTIFGGALVDFRVQGNSRNSSDVVAKIPVALFDLTRASLSNGYQITFEYNAGTPTMRIAQTRANPRIELDSMSDTTGWTAAGDASGLAQDQTVYYDAPAALRFNLAASGSLGTLTKTISSADLTDYTGVGVVFFALRLPSATAITSVTLRLGSSSSAYYSVSATTGFIFSFLSQMWMLVSFDLSGATTTGSPTVTATTYAQLRFAYGGTAASNVYVGGLWISLPSPHTLFFETNAFFLASGGTTPSTSITTDSDTVLMNDAAYSIYEYECATEVAFQMGGKKSSPIIQYLDNVLHNKDTGLYPLYQAANPSQQLRTIDSYY